MRGAANVGHSKDKRVESCQNVNILSHPRLHLPGRGPGPGHRMWMCGGAPPPRPRPRSPTARARTHRPRPAGRPALLYLNLYRHTGPRAPGVAPHGARLALGRGGWAGSVALGLSRRGEAVSVRVRTTRTEGAAKGWRLSRSSFMIMFRNNTNGRRGEGVAAFKIKFHDHVSKFNAPLSSLQEHGRK